MGLCPNAKVKISTQRERQGIPVSNGAVTACHAAGSTTGARPHRLPGLGHVSVAPLLCVERLPVVVHLAEPLRAGLDGVLPAEDVGHLARAASLVRARA